MPRRRKPTRARGPYGPDDRGRFSVVLAGRGAGTASGRKNFRFPTLREARVYLKGLQAGLRDNAETGLAEAIAPASSEGGVK